MKRKLFAVTFALALVAAILTAVAAADTAAVATVGDTSYTDLQEAVDKSNGQLVKLETNGGDITVNGDVSIDLNGFSINSVDVQSGTLYGMDSSTDNYDNPDNCGKIGTVSGSVAGLAAESTLAQDGYLMICEGTEAQTQVSFHRVNLRIHTMTLRGSDAGVYYSCDFEGDQLVADNVEKFGVALSIDEVPDEDNLDTDCGYSYFTGFQAGAGANAGESTSTLLYNVMDETLPDLANTHRANLPVNGRAYILTKDNRYVFGTTASYSFKWATQQADAGLSGYSKDQVAGAVEMYKKFSKVMAKWDVDNIESALCLNTKDPLTTPDKELKILAITSSFGLNTTQLLYDIAIAEGYTDVTVARLYSSGCSLETHVKNAQSAVNGTPKYFYQHTVKNSSEKWTTVKPEDRENSVNGADMIEVLASDNWDIIFIQQGAGQSPVLSTYTDANGQDYIDQLRDLIKPYVKNENARFVWNMLWAYQWDSTYTPFTTVFNSNQLAMYNANVNAVKEKVVPRTDFDRIIPTGTAIQNARTSYFGDALTYDTRHLNTLGSVVAGYTLYSVLTGQELTEIKLTDVPAAAITSGTSTLSLSDEDKLVVLESVNNALKKPFEVTTSQYPPVDYSDYTYTENLSFFGDSKLAVCPACQAKVTWTEIEIDSNGTPTNTTDFGTSMPAGNYHFYLSSDVTYTGSNPFIYINLSTNGQRKVCLHLNSHKLTATNNTVATVGSTGVLNIMGQGTVSGNGTATNRGSTIVVNSGASSATNAGTVRLYSGTYIQPANSTLMSAVSTAQQGGILEIYADAKIEGNTNSLWVNNTNTNYYEAVKIYGGTFTKPVVCSASGTVSAKSTLLIEGGTFEGGIAIDENTTTTISGAPVISGSGLQPAEGVTVTLGELTEGTSIAVDATGAFTAANSNAQTYLDAGYFTAVQAGYGIEAIENILYCQETA